MQSSVAVTPWAAHGPGIGPPHGTDVSLGTPTSVGAVLSSTVIVWLAVRALPQGSVAVQVRVTEYSRGQVPGVVASTKVSVAVPPQASVAVGVAKEGVAGQAMVVGPGSAEMTGAVLSSTMMVWLAVLELPHGSVAVQVRVTERFCGHDPGVVTSAKVRVAVPPHASVAVGVAKEGAAGH